MTGLIDLNPNYLATVERILAEHVPGCEVRAFGSRAAWNAKDYSDLDLAIVGSSLLDWRTISRLKEAFEESDLPMRVDVLDWHDTSESFQRIIEQGYVIVQKGAQEQSVATASERRTRTFGDCALLIRDSVDPSAVGDAPYIGLEHIGESTLSLLGYGVASEVTSTKTSFRCGDILFGKLRPYFRKVVRAPFDGICSTDIWVVRAKEDVDQRFLYYCMASQSFVDFATSGSEGTKMPRAKWEYVSRYEIPIPPLPEQRAIAHILGTLDDKIEMNRRMNETLEEMARTLFKSWFVDFDPVRAKMAGREPYLPPEVWSLFPDRLVPSELGDIPEGWEVGTVGEVAKVIYGAPFSSKRFNDSGLGLPLIRIRDLATHNPSTFTDEQHPKGYLVKPADIVVGMDGEFRAHIWKGSPAWLNQRVCHFKPRPGIPGTFLIEAISNPLAEFERGKVGTTVIHLGKSDIDTIKLVIPQALILDAFAQLSEPLTQRIVNNSSESRTLTPLRDGLLPKLVSAEVRVETVSV